MTSAIPSNDSAGSSEGVSTVRPYQEERPWGNFRRFTQNEQSTVKVISVNPGAVLSLQSHAGRSEFWHVLSGEGAVEIGLPIADSGAGGEIVKTLVKKGDEFFIPVGAKHRLSAAENSALEILEIAMGNFDESDIVRFEDKYGRVS